VIILFKKKTKIKEVQTALYYLLYINPDYKSKTPNKDLIEEYFEKFYFARKKFLVNFLSRKQGQRWNGRFKKLFSKNKENHFIELIKNNIKSKQQNEDSSSLINNFSKSSKSKENNEIQPYITEEEKKRQRNQKANADIKNELDNIFNPLLERYKVI
jgi:hypothetical protein